MFCESCGNKINPGEGFCTQCGAPVKGGATEPVKTVSTPIDPEENKKANNLCIISLILKYGVGVLAGVIYGIFGGLATTTTSYSSSATTGFGMLGTAISGIASLCSLAAFVIMIVVRVKYPKNTFGKVLMWIYIVELILAVIGIIIIVASCAYILQSCSY